MFSVVIFSVFKETNIQLKGGKIRTDVVLCILSFSHMKKRVGLTIVQRIHPFVPTTHICVRSYIVHLCHL